MQRLFDGNESSYPQSRHILSSNFKPTSEHHNEYNLQKNHSELILKAVWNLTFNEWCQFYIERNQLRDNPPVCTGRWLTRETQRLPFMLGNIRCGSGPESDFKTKYKSHMAKGGKWIKCPNIRKGYV